jgi:hypothetical protein
MNYQNELLIDGWKYKINRESEMASFHVLPPKKTVIPQSVFKLFSINKNTVSALQEDKIYVNDPVQFNDLFDCSIDIYTKVESNEILLYKYLLETTYGITTVNSWNNEQLIWRCRQARHQLNLGQFGVVCFTAKPDSVLMWAYYGNNKGFMIEYDTDQFPANFFGPFKVFYQDKIKKLDKIKLQKNYDAIDPALAFLYQSTIKSKVWEHESEYRYLAGVPDLDGELLEDVEQRNTGNPQSRLFDFPKQTIKSIRLGYNFFAREEKLETEANHLKVNLNKSPEKIKILDYIIQNELDCYHVLKSTDLTKIYFIKGRVKKVSRSVYIIQKSE